MRRQCCCGRGAPSLLRQPSTRPVTGAPCRVNDAGGGDLEAERGSQDLQAAVDLVRAEQDDALGRGGRRRRAQRVDGAGEGAGEQGAGPRGGPRR